MSEEYFRGVDDGKREAADEIERLRAEVAELSTFLFASDCRVADLRRHAAIGRSLPDVRERMVRAMEQANPEGIGIYYGLREAVRILDAALAAGDTTNHKPEGEQRAAVQDQPR